MEIRISIIMGIYNCAETLPEAIDSLVQQTYTGWKLIMCDDGSSDTTYTVAAEYQKKFPEKIILIKNDKNRGLNYTLNHCLQYADTEYVARMDGDDISLPERLEKEIHFLDTHPAYAIVSCPMIYFDEYGDWGHGSAGGEAFKEDLAKGTPFCHAPCMVRREAYAAVNGYSMNEDRLRVEDWDLWVRMYTQGYTGYVLPERLYKMRDDRMAYSRRKFKFRINEAKVSLSAIRLLHLSSKNYIWVLRPIIVGLLPRFIYDFLHRKRLQSLT